MDLNPFQTDPQIGGDRDLGLWPICTMYTVDDGRGYIEEAREWNNSFRGIDRFAGFIKGPATWREACYLKPQFLYSAVRALQGRARSITWIDADARLADAYQLENLRMSTRGDVVVRRRMSEAGQPEILGGTISLHLHDPARIMGFLSAWIAALTAESPWSDQPALAKTLEQHEARGLDVRYMGPECAWIFDLDAARYPAIEHAGKALDFREHRGPAVVHMQASRRRKNLKEK